MMVWLIIMKHNDVGIWKPDWQICHCVENCLLIVQRMDPADRKHLQRLWLKLLHNITDYKGITDGLFAEGILTPALKEKVVSTVAFWLTFWTSRKNVSLCDGQCYC